MFSTLSRKHDRARKPISQENQDFPTVLVVTSDDALRRLVAQKLQKDQFHVLKAESADVALTVIISHSRPIHVMVLDVGLGGFESAGWLKRYRPDMQLVRLVADLKNVPGALALDATLSSVRGLIGHHGREKDAGCESVLAKAV